jgi:general secretion pathway protein E
MNALLTDMAMRDAGHFDLPQARAVLQWLIDAGHLQEPEADDVFLSTSRSGRSLLATLFDLGLGDDVLFCAATAISGIPAAKDEAWPDAPVLSERLPFHFLKDNAILPLSSDGTRLSVAIADPTQTWIAQALSLATAQAVDVRLAPLTRIDAALDDLYGERHSVFRELAEQLGNRPTDELSTSKLALIANGEPVVRVVNHILERAIEQRATDIHIEPFEKRLILRYRVDGVLRQEEAPSLTSSAPLTSRIKIMTNLDIAERRMPQDGRMRVRIRGEDVDLRVSTLPTPFGESVVIRVLRADPQQSTLETLGINADMIAALQRALARMQGLLLVSGPTGSGKTTTLYSLLRLLNAHSRKIVTVEDPIEYQLEGVNQVQVKSDIGLDFPAVLRSTLRQDPDVIMIGEIRDIETAHIAMQAAMTGHLVLSTLHTISATASVTRLLNMGVPGYVLADALSLVMAQRLVRRFCGCAEAAEDTAAVRAACSEAGIDPAEALGVRAQRGCPHCSQSGYRGRLAICEILEMDTERRRIVLEGASDLALRESAAASGMRSMRHNGLRAVLAGHTALAEVIRATATE